MSDQEFDIINRETKKQKLIDFAKRNKNIFFSIVLIILFCVIGFFSYEMYLNKKRVNLANKYNNLVNNYENGNNANILQSMTEIISARDTTYSPLALYYLIDKDLIDSNQEVNKYFDIIINDLGLNQNLVDLNLYKKVLYNSDKLNEDDLLKMIDPILSSKNIWQSHAMYLLAEYYYSKGKKVKSLSYYQSIIADTNSNSDIRLEAQKRVQRDFSE